MVTRQHTFEVGEWYHCYSRGIEKHRIFLHKTDYERFEALLYLANAQPTLQRSDLGERNLKEILELPRRDTLVGIGAFCLMPNHFHLLIKETSENSISNFMLKLMTAYSMYFNVRYKHQGAVFARPYRSRHVSDDRYFQQVIAYIHLNPAELFESEWKKGIVKDYVELQQNLEAYPYSSLIAYENSENHLINILDKEVFSVYEPKDLSQTVGDAYAYYQEWRGEPSP